MSSQTPEVPQLYGRYAQLPAWIMQTTDPGGQDFQRSFRSTLDFLRDVSGGLMQNGLATQNLRSATGLGQESFDPRLMPVTGVRQEAEKHGMARVADWIKNLAGPDGLDRNTYDDLIGQARAHDIANPESWNPNQLAQEVERKRTENFLNNFEGMTPAKTVGNLALFEATGIGKSMVDIAREIPFVGDWISSFETVRGADQYLSKLNEYYRTGYAGDPTDKAAEMLATGIGYSAASYAVWQGLGAAAVRTGLAAAPAEFGAASRILRYGYSPIATRMPGIAKMALQGGADAWILAGGGDKPLESRAINILQGATLGGLAGVGGVAGGALAGGVAGGAIGGGAAAALSDGDPKDIMIGVGIGASLGAGVGSLQAIRALRSRAQASFPESEVGTYSSPAEKARMISDIPVAGFTDISGRLGAGPEPNPGPGPVRIMGALGPGEPIAGPTVAEPNPLTSPPTAAVDVPGTTGLQVSRGYEPLNTPEERAQIEMQRRVSAARDAGMPLSADAIGDQYQSLLRQDPRYVSDPVVSNKKIPIRDERGRFVSAKKGSAIAKQEAILTSPALAELGQKPAFGDGDVITALEKTAPGQAVVTEVTNPQSLSSVGLQRMKDEGFNTELTLYHGTPTAFDSELKPEYNDAVYLTPDPGVANAYSGMSRYSGPGEPPRRPNIRPVYVRLQNPKVIDYKNATEWMSASKDVQQAKAEGHDGVILRNVIDQAPVETPTVDQWRAEDTRFADAPDSAVIDAIKYYMEAQLGSDTPNVTPQTQYVVFDPQNIRPKFWVPEDLKMTQLPNGKIISTTGMTDAQYSQLENHGVFDNQLVKTADGVEGVVAESNGDGFSLIKGMNGEPSRIVRTDELLPAPYGAAIPEYPGFYDAFKDYASRRMVEETAEAGLPAHKLSWTDDAMSSQLTRYLGEFYDLNKVSASERPKMTGAIDKARHQDIMNLLDPQEHELYRSMQNDIDEDLNALTINDERHIFPTVEDYAASRGFDVEYGVGDEPRITLTHTSGEPHSFSLSHEAIEFLKEFHATDADLLPGGFGDGVSQSAGSLRENGSSGANLTYKGAIDVATETAKIYERMAGGGGNGGGSIPPSIGGGGSSGQLPPGDSPVDVAGAIQRHAQAGTAAYLETLGRVNSGFQRAWEPAITRIMRLEEMLTDRMQVAGATPWADVYRVSQGSNIAASEAVEWGKRFDEAVKGVSRKHMRRGGGLFEIMEMDPAYREGVADMLGYKPAEKAAFSRIKAFTDEMRSHALDHGLEIGNIEQYMPHMRQFLSGQITIDQVPDQMKWAALELREGGLDSLETDVSVVMGRYIRGMTRQIHMKEPYEKATAIWNDKRIPDELAYPVKQYLHDMYYGRTETGMISLLLRDMVNTVGKPFGVKATSQDIGAATNMLLRMKYVNMLGRVYQIMRNIPQPLWTAGEIGIKHGFEPFARFYSSPSYANETMQMAFEKGWVERNAMAVDQADVFQPTRYNPAQGDPVLTPEDLARRGQLREAVNLVMDLIPGGASGLNRILTLPLKPFSGLSNINRAISARAGYNWAWDGIRKFDSEPSMSEDQLIEYMNPGSTIARKPVTNEFLRLLRIGDREGAASFMGSVTADNQGRYGFAETPEKMKGDGGRIVSMLGRFSQQILRRFKDGLAAGTPSAKARFLAGQAVMVGILGATAEKYGMRGLMKYWPSLGMFFGGGPGLQTAVDIATVAGSPASLLGGNLNYGQKQALTNLGNIDPLGFNPYGGLMLDAQGVASAVQGTQPFMSTLGVMTTGNPALGPRPQVLPPTDLNAWLHGAVPESYPDINGVLQQRQYGSGPIDTIAQPPSFLPPVQGGIGSQY